MYEEHQEEVMRSICETSSIDTLRFWKSTLSFSEAYSLRPRNLSYIFFFI